jgi:hypothetical protein
MGTRSTLILQLASGLIFHAAGHHLLQEMFFPRVLSQCNGHFLSTIFTSAINSIGGHIGHKVNRRPLSSYKSLIYCGLLYKLLAKDLYHTSKVHEVSDVGLYAGESEDKK